MKVDIARHIGAVTRRVEARFHEGRPARVAIATRDYDTTVEDLWDAVTNPERIPRWFLPISGDLRLGGHFQLEGNAGGEIIACEPPRRFEVTWACNSPVSWVTVTLQEEGDGTRLELEHLTHIEGDFWDQFGPGAVGVGWELGLMGLGEHTATGFIADPAAAAAWSASAEGKDFVRRSSKAWGEASIAGGGSPV
jgi:uncharacterized protein YndB with AHSA1/START domain